MLTPKLCLNTGSLGDDPLPITPYVIASLCTRLVLDLMRVFVRVRTKLEQTAKLLFVHLDKMNVVTVNRQALVAVQSRVE